MSEIVIRPTLKFIRAGYVLALVAALAGAVFAWREQSWWPLAAVVVLLWPAARHVRRQSTCTIIEGDKLRYQTGVLSRSTRTILLSKVQDVRVDQSLGQRLWRVGNVAIETAGEASRLMLRDIDQPQQIADDISGASHRGAAV